MIHIRQSKQGVLQGWKEIAAYVARDTRTVKRWEKERGLPVRRLPGDGRAGVYALIADIDEWLLRPNAGGQGVQAPETAPDSPRNPDRRADDASAAPSAATATGGHAKSIQRWRMAWMGMAAAVTLLSLAAMRGSSVDGVGSHPSTRSAERAIGAASSGSPSDAARAGSARYASNVVGVDGLVVMGMVLLEQRTPQTLERAAKCFEDAVAKDPGDAPAWAGLAQTDNLLREYGTLPSDVAFARAKAAAQRAIAIDPALPQAHAALGFVAFFSDWDASVAEREFRAAIALDPTAHLPHHWYGSMLIHQRRFAEALVQLAAAQRAKPDSLAVLSLRAYALGLSGQRQAATTALQTVLAEDRTFPSAHRVLANLDLMPPRDLHGYLEQCRQLSALSQDRDESLILDAANRAYLDGGEGAMWRALLAGEERVHPSIRNVRMIEAEMALGDPEAVLRDLRWLVERRDPYAAGVALNPLLASLRSDPRFRRLLPPGLRIALP